MRLKTVERFIIVAEYVFWAVFLLNAVNYSMYARPMNAIAASLAAAHSYRFYKAAKKPECILFGVIAAVLALGVITKTSISFHIG